jgi:hypothetical protein
MANAPALPEQIVYLIIRFTASIPDLPLSINTRRTTFTLSLKQLIRQHLPSEHASARLRLIYAGKVLADTDPLSKSLRLPPPPPPRNVRKNSDGVGLGGGDSGEASKSKGKQPLRETPAIEYGTTKDIPPEAKKYYIHCSLGDPLSTSELDSEAKLAQDTKTTFKSQYTSSSSIPSTSASQRRASATITDGNARRRSSTTSTTANTVPQAQGFDRLLSSGFTRDEIASLRATFTQNLSFTHTPDTMPTPAQIRVLEDRWLDSSANDPSSSLTGTTAAGGAGGAETGWGAGFAVEEGGLDDMLYGYLTGFFFPLGSLVWGFREEGVWTRRRQVAVVMGVVLNCVFGFMRWGG